MDTVSVVSAKLEATMLFKVRQFETFLVTTTELPPQSISEAFSILVRPIG
jgi:hypothetical protein